MSMSLSAIADQKQTFFMQEALQEAAKGRLIAPPNPWVGCVIVKHGAIIARGHTQAPGQPHAEIMALNAAGESAQEATVYVTLEPCPHFGNTPPCTEALIKAGVKKVVIGILDPDPHVRGRGVAQLQQAGIEVEVGTLHEKIKASLKPYCHHRETGRPYCILKAAVSMDGKIAARDGSSFWITKEEARRDVHQLRAMSQAILVGTFTALEDSPQLTVRDIEDKNFTPPLRVILDAKGKIQAKGPLFDTSLAPTLMVTSNLVDPLRKKEWLDCGCEVVEISMCQNGLNLQELLNYLGQRGVLQLLVEGGSGVFSSLMQSQLLNQLILYMGGCLLGAEGVSLFSNLKLENINDAIRLRLKDFTRFGEDLRLDYVF